MDAILERCAGLDVHQETVVACVLHGPLDRKPKQEIRTFATTTRGLLELLDWLADHQVSHVAMESTGVYWKPVWNVLEGSFQLLLANAQRIKNVPGRKTDVKDSAWIAKLLRSGLIEGSMVPSLHIRDLRDFTRYRRKLLSASTSEKNRIHKILQDANIKLTTYMSDVFGVSGRALLESLVNGEVLDPKQVLSMVHSTLRSKVPQLIEALNGRLRTHHRLMIRMHRDHLEYVEKQISELERLIDEQLIPYKEEIDLLDTIPGIDRNAAASILAETGPDMSVFPTEAQITSWGGMCPGNNESAGKKKSSRTRKSNRGLKAILCQVATCAARTKKSRLSSFYYRVLKRRGPNKAKVALGHLILRIIYHMLKHRVVYEELGHGFMEENKKTLNRLVRSIQDLGYEITISSKTTPLTG